MSAQLKANPELYRAELLCRIGQRAIEFRKSPIPGVEPGEWALFNLLSAVEDIVKHLAKEAQKP